MGTVRLIGHLVREGRTAALVAATAVLAQGVIPAVELVLVHAFVALAASYANDGRGAGNATILIVGLSLAVMGASLLNPAITFALDLLRVHTHRSLMSAVLADAATVSLAEFESAAYQSALSRQRDVLGGRMVHFFNGLAAVLSGFITMVVYVVALLSVAQVSVAAIGICAAAATAWARARGAAGKYLLEYSAVEIKRRQRYYADLILDPEKGAEVRSLGVGGWAITRWKALHREWIQRVAREERAGILGGTAGGLASSVGLVIILILVGHGVSDGRVGVPGLSVVVVATMRLFPLTAKLIRDVTEVGSVGALAADGLSNPHATAAGGAGVTSADGVRLENVSFEYEQGGQPVLTNVTLTIHPGESVALVGENGAGKTTLVRIVTGLYQPTSGRVVPLGPCGPTGAVLQEFARYDLPVYDNIAVGDVAHFDDGIRVEQCASKCGVVHVYSTA